MMVTTGPWVPAQAPYRVHFTRAGSYTSRYCSRSETFATREEAATYLAAQLPAEPKGVTPHLELAVNVDDWHKRGKWVKA